MVYIYGKVWLIFQVNIPYGTFQTGTTRGMEMIYFGQVSLDDSIYQVLTTKNRIIFIALEVLVKTGEHNYSDFKALSFISSIICVDKILLNMWSSQMRKKNMS